MAYWTCPDLADEIADAADCRSFPAQRLGIHNRERGGAALAAAHPAHGGGARDDHQKIGSEALDLLADRLVRALTDRDHGDQRGYADEDAQHGERGSHLVAGERLQCSGHDHQGEGLHSARAAAACDRRRRLSSSRRQAGRYPVSDFRRPWPDGRLSFVRYHLAVPHGDDAIGIGRDIGFMGDDDNGNATLAIERLQRLHDLMRVPGIEIAGRLVRKQQDRIVDQGARDGDALLLAAGQLPGRVALPVGQAEQLERRPRPLGALGSAGCARRRIEQGQRDVLDRAGTGKKIEALKDKTKPFAADARELGLRQFCDIDAFEIISLRWTADRGSRAATSRWTFPIRTIP